MPAKKASKPKTSKGKRKPSEYNKFVGRWMLAHPADKDGRPAITVRFKAAVAAWNAQKKK
jgi:hypothetical protein